MPNQVTSHNDRTMMKALRALTQDGAMTLDEGMDALDRLSNAGLLIREPAEKDDKPSPRGSVRGETKETT